VNSPFLLDTCVCLWMMQGTLSQKTADALTKAHNSTLPSYVSPITAWEIAVGARKGRFKSHLSPQRWFEALMTAPGLALADMAPDVLIASQLLPGEIHNDPADRIIAATARECGFTVVTRDGALLDYGRAGHLSVLEC
jgi:PIN domain nuclease of toxin-antitoxin system